jgi:hypothetical protein
MARVICIKCKHDTFEHIFDEETQTYICYRVMSIEAGKYYFCRCQIIKKEGGNKDEININR